MPTAYAVVTDKFIKKLKGDTSFFNYKNLTDAEIEALVEDHLTSLLNRAIDTIYLYGLPDFDFYDKDDDLQTFNGDLIPQEVSLLTDVMYFAYAEEDKNKLKVLGLTFRSSELNVFSPANERKSFLDMIEKIEISVVNSISNYLSRDRLTWKLKSIYGGN